MAAHSRTIRNGIGIVGGGPASLWNAFNWGAFKWGEGTRDIGQNVVKQVSSSISPTTSIPGFRVLHQIALSLSPTTTLGKSVTHPIREAISTSDGFGRTLRLLVSESLTATGDMSSERVYDGAGYQRNFPDRTPEGERRTFATWSAPASSVSGWATAAAASTTWSDA